MQGMNRVTIVGNVVEVPELRSTSIGGAVLSFTVAVNERVKRSGQWEQHTEFFRVSVNGRSAGHHAPMLSKGSGVHVEGLGRHSTYVGRDGVERTSFAIYASNVLLVGLGAVNASMLKRDARRE